MLSGWVGRGRISDLCRLVGRVVEQDGDVVFSLWKHVQNGTGWGGVFGLKVILG